MLPQASGALTDAAPAPLAEAEAKYEDDKDDGSRTRTLQLEKAKRVAQKQAMIETAAFKPPIESQAA